MFPLICAWINGWVNNREAGDLRRHLVHYDVIVMIACIVQVRASRFSCILGCTCDNPCHDLRCHVRITIESVWYDILDFIYENIFRKNSIKFNHSRDNSVYGLCQWETTIRCNVRLPLADPIPRTIPAFTSLTHHPQMPHAKPLSQLVLGYCQWGTNFSEILIKIQNFSFTKMHMKISFTKSPFCLGLIVLSVIAFNICIYYRHNMDAYRLVQTGPKTNANTRAPEYLPVINAFVH